MVAISEFTVIVKIYGQLGAIPKPYSKRMFCKNYIFINSNLLNQKKDDSGTKKFQATHAIALSKGKSFCEKLLLFCIKRVTSTNF